MGKTPRDQEPVVQLSERQSRRMIVSGDLKRCGFLSATYPRASDSKNIMEEEVKDFKSQMSDATLCPFLYDKKAAPMKSEQHGCLIKTQIMTPVDVSTWMEKISQSPTPG